MRIIYHIQFSYNICIYFVILFHLSRRRHIVSLAKKISAVRYKVLLAAIIPLSVSVEVKASSGVAHVFLGRTINILRNGVLLLVLQVSRQCIDIDYWKMYRNKSIDAKNVLLKKMDTTQYRLTSTFQGNQTPMFEIHS